MTPGAIAKRNADATERMKQAAATLAERFGVDASVLNVSSVGGPEVKALKEREAVADLLEQLVARSADLVDSREVAGSARRKAS